MKRTQLSATGRTWTSNAPTVQDRWKRGSSGAPAQPEKNGIFSSICATRGCTCTDRNQNYKYPRRGWGEPERSSFYHAEGIFDPSTLWFSKKQQQQRVKLSAHLVSTLLCAVSGALSIKPFSSCTAGSRLSHTLLPSFACRLARGERNRKEGDPGG